MHILFPYFNKNRGKATQRTYFFPLRETQDTTSWQSIGVKYERSGKRVEKERDI